MEARQFTRIKGSLNLKKYKKIHNWVGGGQRRNTRPRKSETFVTFGS